MRVLAFLRSRPGWYSAGMSQHLFDELCVLVPFLGVLFIAFYVRLVVRIIKRRERWAKRLAASLAALFLGYLVSFGPIARIESRGGWSPLQETVFEAAYFPFGFGVNFGPQWMQSSILWYLDLWDAIPEAARAKLRRH